MPKRIYALAKELAMDSKELVNLCNKIGITNKGSALASLEDDEVARIEKHLAGGEAKSEEPEAAPARVEAPTRPSGPLAQRLSSRPKVLDAPKQKAKSAEPEAVEPEPAVAVNETVETVEPPPAPEPPAPEPVKEAPAQPAPIRRETIISPTATGRVRSLDRRGSDGDKGDSGAKRSQQKREPVIKVARVPKSDQPIPNPKS